MEVSASLLKAQRLRAWQGAGDSRGPRRPGTLAASAASQAGRRRGGGERDGCLRKNCKKEKQEIQPSVQSCPLPPKPPGAVRWPQEVSRVKAVPWNTLPAHEKAFSGMRSW